MNPDPAPSSTFQATPTDFVPPTSGMTTKVVKGSLWTLIGQVAPLIVSLFTTPFVIRMLGTDGYGALVLIGVIPNYFLFADFGMGLASTKFGTEAYVEGNIEKEGRIVRGAVVIGLATSLPIAISLFTFSESLVSFFKVPEHLSDDASFALRLTAAAFVPNLLSTIVNTPQLSRLRMDLNSQINAGFRIAGLLLTPVVLYLGYSIVGVATLLLVTSILTFIVHVCVSRHLLPSLFEISIGRVEVKRLLLFGSGMVAGLLASLMLANLDRGILPRIASVTALAHYTVAFTFVAMVTMFANSMIQSLVPALSGLQSTQNTSHRESLYSQGIRLTFVWLIPSTAFFAIAAEPFFTFWAGPEYGRESTPLFYILILGAMFNVPAYVPYAAIVAAGRTDIFPKLYIAELLPYIVFLVLLVSAFGATGAAVATSVRMVIDAILLFVIARRVAGVSRVKARYTGFVMGATVMLIPVALSWSVAPPISFSMVLFACCFCGYISVLWKFVLSGEETRWLHARVWRPLSSRR